MKKRSVRRRQTCRTCMFLSLAFSLLVVSVAQTAPKGAPKPVAEPKTLLLIGNSYSAQIRRTLQQLIRHEKLSYKVEAITPGGKTLTWHLANGAPAKLKTAKPDLVLLQEQSQTPGLPGHRENFLKSSADLAEKIRTQGATPALYQTWGRRDGDKRNPKLYPDFATMNGKLAASYQQAATDSGATLVPIGDLWAAVRKADPLLGKKLYRGDGSHPSAHGATLVSFAIASTLLGETPDSITFKGPLTDAEFATLRNAAKAILTAPAPEPKKESPLR